MVRIIDYTPEYREEVLALSLRAWEPVFPLVRATVPGFVYEAFYCVRCMFWRWIQFTSGRGLAEPS
jgi:hypothetical protein